MRLTCSLAYSLALARSHSSALSLDSVFFTSYISVSRYLYLPFSLPSILPPPLSLLLSSFKHILHRIFHCVTGWWPVVTRTVVSVATMISLDHLVPPPP